ncbi:LysR substrate-binding domain-containing protein [Chiayiivirga flava]|uniref:DNA-binding transcriptional LysR family regulator n=1 Tax=Chiayiivirga flava TaxID=659595 RepID=A0A7W8FYY6_9GAMM|nr:LysR substrate-binding domain-containing protein [Chiayiivirga flava]MBB5207621.1 DNA-binding transcriptional LysR family regulator [Chiayiivirga flava]
MIPDLADLDAFVAVARARGFRRAAYLGNVSASALSEAVRRLEARLDTRLLQRSTRSVTPTEAGQRLLDRLEPALGGVADALAALHADGDEPAGTLRLNVPTIVASHVLPPIVARFLHRHPHVRMEVIGDDRFIDVLGAGFDAGVRYDERLERDMIAVPLGPREQRFVVAGAPAWFARHGRPTHPDQLRAEHCIGHRFASGLVAVWEFERGDELIRIAPAGRVIGSHSGIEVQAAVDGLGLVASFDEFLRPAIDAGLLEAVLGDWLPPFPGPKLYFSGRHQTAPLRAFVDFLRTDASSTADATPSPVVPAALNSEAGQAGTQ